MKTPPDLKGALGAVFRVTAKIRNNRLIEAREALGYKTAREAAEKLGLPYSTLVGYETLHETPRNRRGEYRSVVIRIATAYRNVPEWFWPEETEHVTQREVSIRCEAPIGFLNAPPMPDEKLLADERLEGVLTATKDLSWRQEHVFKRYHDLVGEGPVTFEELGKELGVSGTSVQQTLRVAESKMRTLLRLRGFFNAEEQDVRTKKK
jgi:DNA-directed RNA polymerase specialized sigma24 family protein